MKKHIITFISILALLQTACNHTTENNTLLIQADSLLKSQPDSALRILQSIPTEDLKTEADIAYHALLLTQARDKNYIAQTDDSLIRIAVQYYDAHKQAEMQARAYYCWGSVYRDKNEQAAATEKYLLAIPFAEKANNQHLLGRIYNNAAFLYFLQKLYKKADSAYRQTELIGSRLGDIGLHAEALLMQGRIKIKQKDYALAEKKLLQAQSISNEHGQKRLRAEIANTMSNFYSLVKDAAKALQYAKQYLALQEDTVHCHKAFYTLGESFFRVGQYDSASYYLHKSLGTRSHGIKANAYMRLADIAQAQGNTAFSLEMERLHSAYKDSVAQSSQQAKVLEVHWRINAMQQKASYETSVNKYVFIILSLIGICVIVVLLLLRRYLKYRKRERQQLHREDELRHNYAKQQELIRHKEKEILILQEKIAEQQIGETQKQALRTELAGLSEQHKTLIQKIRKYSDVIQKIENILSTYKEGKTPKIFLDEEDWARLLVEIDKKEVISRIHKDCRLSTIEFHLCVLLLLDYPVVDMGKIIQRDRTAIYRLERSVMKKMGRPYQAGELQKLLKNMVNGYIKE